MLFSQTSLSTGYVPGYSFGCIHDFRNGLSTKLIRKTKVIIQLDKSLSKWYSNEDELNLMHNGLTVVINLTAIAYVSMLGNAVLWMNANICHDDIQGNNWD